MAIMRWTVLILRLHWSDQKLWNWTFCYQTQGQGILIYFETVPRNTLKIYDVIWHPTPRLPWYMLWYMLIFLCSWIALCWSKVVCGSDNLWQPWRCFERIRLWTWSNRAGAGKVNWRRYGVALLEINTAHKMIDTSINLIMTYYRRLN